MLCWLCLQRAHRAAHRLGGVLARRQLGQRAIETIAREEFYKDFDLLTQRYYEGSGGRLVPRELGGGVRTSARYRVTIEVSGHNQKHPWGDLVQTDPTQPFRIGLHVADARNGGIAGPTSRTVQVWTLPGDGKRRNTSSSSDSDIGFVEQMRRRGRVGTKDQRRKLG